MKFLCKFYRGLMEIVMENNLSRLALRLSEAEIQELLRLKKGGLKKTKALRKRRDALAARLAKLDRRIAEMTGEETVAASKPEAVASPVQAGPAKRGRKPGKRPAASRTSGGDGRMIGITAAIRAALSGAKGQPLKAAQVVDAMPGIGIKVDNVAEMRQRVSILL
ncbi:MAG: hypothetical protein LBV15_04445, partial [Planctomycetota bacterium]|nr:hypothetical protein [Planctomycetota bacterium]